MDLTAVIWQEEEMFVALCPELDIASQGYSIEEAQANLKDAVEGVLEVASASEIERLLRRQSRVMPLKVAA